jgi:hypothetical protein
MGVYIKGMEMPTSCLSCPLQGGTADCRLTQKTYNWGLSERPSDCPLVPVPPHGRLIDADALCKEGRGNCYGCPYDVCIIANAPTIIEAEEGEG